VGLFGWAVIALQLAGTAPSGTAGEAYVRQAAVYRKARDYARATSELRRALEIQPDLRDAHGMLGEILLAQGFAAEAAPHLEKAGASYFLALALLELNRLPEAVVKLLAESAKRPDDPEVLFHLGEGCGSLMQQAFNRLMRLHPGSAQARTLETGKRDSPPPKLEDLLPSFPGRTDDPEVLWRVGQASGERMRQAFDRLVRLHPGSARAAEFKARNYLGQGHGDLAEPLLRTALSKNPDLPGAHMALGRIMLEARGDLASAEKEFRSEALLRPGDSEAAWRLGSLLQKKGDSKDALAELERANRLKPDMLETLVDLGKAYSSESRIEDAEKTFRRVISIEDTDELAAAAHLQLAQICRKLGKTAEAGQHLQRFRELQRREKDKNR
jgi:tetratricopeptide (TPR) repeat protein